MSRAGLGLCPTRTRPDIIGWGRFQPETGPPEVSNQLGRVILVFGCESVSFGFFNSQIFGRNLVGSCQIWPNLMRVGQDSFGSMKIWPRFGRVGVGLIGVLVEFE